MARRKIYEDWDADTVKGFVKDGWTNEDIADYFGVSERTAKKALEWFAIERDRDYSADELDDVEEQIRNALIEGLEIGEGLGNSLIIAYDDINDLWVVNEYVSTRKGYNFPVEIHIKHNRIHDTFDVEKLELRGKKREDLEKQLSRYL